MTLGSTVLGVIILIDDFTLIRDGGNFYLSVIQDPQLLRIQDPFGKLIVKTKINVVIDAQEIFQAAQN